MPRVATVTKKTRNPNKLAKLIRDGIAKSGLPATVIAERASIHRTHLSYVLDGKKSLGRAKLLALADVLKISREAMLAAAGYFSAGSSDVNRAAPDLSEITLLRTVGGPPLKVVTDVRFFDSALFMWLFSTQPFRAANIAIDCEMIQENWASVPAFVSKESSAIGFYNRRAIRQQGGVDLYRVGYWADLSIYKGYALFANEQGASLSDAKSANEYLTALKQKRGGTLMIVAGVQDVEWRFRTPVVPALNDAVQYLPYDDADFALHRFMNDQIGDLFVGGLPQNMKLRDNHYIEVMNFNINPYLFSLNALICSEQMQSSRPGRAMLWTVTSLWCQTISRLKTEAPFRAAAADGIMRMLSLLGINEPSITPSNLDRLLVGDGTDYEYFPERPTDIIDHLSGVLRRIQGAHADEYLETFNDRI